MTWRDLLEAIKAMDESVLDDAAYVQDDNTGELLMAARIQEPNDDGYDDHYLVVR